MIEIMYSNIAKACNKDDKNLQSPFQNVDNLVMRPNVTTCNHKDKLVDILTAQEINREKVLKFFHITRVCVKINLLTKVFSCNWKEEENPKFL